MFLSWDSATEQDIQCRFFTISARKEVICTSTLRYSHTHTNTEEIFEYRCGYNIKIQ